MTILAQTLPIDAAGQGSNLVKFEPIWSTQFPSTKKSLFLATIPEMCLFHGFPQYSDPKGELGPKSSKFFEKIKQDSKNETNWPEMSQPKEQFPPSQNSV